MMELDLDQRSSEDSLRNSWDLKRWVEANQGSRRWASGRPEQEGTAGIKGLCTSQPLKEGQNISPALTRRTDLRKLPPYAPSLLVSTQPSTSSVSSFWSAPRIYHEINYLERMKYICFGNNQFKQLLARAQNHKSAEIAGCQGMSAITPLCFVKSRYVFSERGGEWN